MKLVSMTTHEPLSFDGLRLGQNARITPGEGQFADWRLHVRGPRVILVSPRGWQPGDKRAPTDERTMFDIPREKVTLRWAGVEAEVDGIAKWSPDAEVQTPARTAAPDGLLSSAAIAAGVTAESGAALMSDAPLYGPDAEEAQLEREQPKKGKR